VEAKAEVLEALVSQKCFSLKNTELLLKIQKSIPLTVSFEEKKVQSSHKNLKVLKRLSSKQEISIAITKVKA
jgi:hypothetical protein